ncbi:MAG: hypothetical protein B6242_17515 [Anaerolineaceae bacterium 4572_78]|nr:MAG: hypothetical protein B6242_17515 [Anaerolineaceae bacterium 4572_78]
MQFNKILNLTDLPVDKDLEKKGVIELPQSEKIKILEMLKADKPVTPHETRERARIIALTASQFTASRVLVEGPKWIITDLITELQASGKTPIYGIRQGDGSMRILCAS